MSANDDFFRSRKAAAVLKHGILKRYPVVFASKTGQGKPVVFLDGYAGRGEYEEEGEEGSPLLLSRCADTVRSFRSVLLFFVEKILPTSRTCSGFWSSAEAQRGAFSGRATWQIICQRSSRLLVRLHSLPSSIRLVLRLTSVSCAQGCSVDPLRRRRRFYFTSASLLSRGWDERFK